MIYGPLLASDTVEAAIKWMGTMESINDVITIRVSVDV